MRLVVFAVAIVAGGALSGCYGGCPLLPATGTVAVSPETACLTLHVEGAQSSDSSARCVGGITVVGTNGCADAVVLTPPTAAPDGGPAQELTFAPGAAVRFDVDEALGTSTPADVKWAVPARLGASTLLTVDVTVRQNR